MYSCFSVCWMLICCYWALQGLRSSVYSALIFSSELSFWKAVPCINSILSFSSSYSLCLIKTSNIDLNLYSSIFWNSLVSSKNLLELLCSWGVEAWLVFLLTVPFIGVMLLTEVELEWLIGPSCSVFPGLMVNLMFRPLQVLISSSCIPFMFFNVFWSYVCFLVGLTLMKWKFIPPLFWVYVTVTILFDSSCV